MKTRFYLTKNCVFLAKEVSLRYNPYTVGLCTHNETVRQRCCAVCLAIPNYGGTYSRKRENNYEQKISPDN